MSQIDPDFPVQGERPWGNKLNAALGEMVDQGNASDAELSGRLSDASLGETYLPFGYKTIPEPVRPIHVLQTAPPGTVQSGPLETTTLYGVTDANPTQLVSLGIQSHTIYGPTEYGSPASKGIAHGATTLMDVQTSVDDMNEHSVNMGWMRYRAGAKGRAWFTDWSLLGPIGTQPGLLNGITMLVNNYYNGSPIAGASAGQWIVTKPTAGAGGEDGHTFSQTYKVDVGLGIVGYGGFTGARTRGYETAIQIGGVGSGWLGGGDSSIIGTGISISGTEVRAIQINPTGIGGEIRWGSNVAIRPVATDGLQILVSNGATHKLGFYGRAPVTQAAAIASPTADVAALKTAVDAVRAALTNLGLTA